MGCGCCSMPSVPGEVSHLISKQVQTLLQGNGEVLLNQRHPDNPLQVVTFPMPCFLKVLVHGQHILAILLTFITKMLPLSLSQFSTVKGLDPPVIQLCGKCDISLFHTEMSHSSERQGKGMYVQLQVPKTAARAPRS